MALTAGNIKMKPCRVTFGEDVAQVVKVTCRADAAADLNNDYFFLYKADGTKYHAWFNVASGGTDPAPSGSTEIEVAIASGATATAVATALASAIDGISGLSATSSNSVVTVTLDVAGEASVAHEGVGTGFVFKVQQYGSSAIEVGYTDGDMTITPNPTFAAVTSHQYGATEIGGFYTGIAMEIGITLKETTKTQIRRLLNASYGGTGAGAGASGTEVSGFGTERLFLNEYDRAQKLVFHPLDLPSGDLSEDFAVWKSVPRLNDLTLSGENVFMLPVTFKAYPDLAKLAPINIMAYGDHTQTLAEGTA